jgi:hypothetical protein
MRFAPHREIVNCCVAADGKGLAMLEFEKAAFFAAPSSLVDERALAAIACEDFSPHGSRHIPRALRCLDARTWIRILCL